jgi:hypothetical protein
LVIDQCSNIPKGETIISGTRYSDGKQIICTIKIDTGEMTWQENNNPLPITELIPLN